MASEYPSCGLITLHLTLRWGLQRTRTPCLTFLVAVPYVTGQVLWKQMWSQSSSTSHLPGIITCERKGEGTGP